MKSKSNILMKTYSHLTKVSPNKFAIKWPDTRKNFETRVQIYKARNFSSINLLKEELIVVLYL